MLVEAIRILVCGIILLIIEVGAGSLIEIKGIRPDLLLLFSLTVTMRFNRYVGLITALLCGLAHDIFSLHFLGVEALAKSSVIFWCGVWLDKYEITVSGIGWFLISTLLIVPQGLIVSFFSLQGSDQSVGNYFIRTVLPSALYTGVVAYLWGLSRFKTKYR